MATVTHHIYSHYDPEQREALQRRQTGQLAGAASADGDAAWAAETPFGARPRLAPPPQFVRAVVPDGEWRTAAAAAASSRSRPRSSASAPGEDVASWYRSLTSASRTPRSRPSAPPRPRPPSPPAEPTTPPQQPREQRTRHNWFIWNAIQCEPPPARCAPRADTLPDRLARNPPPLPHERRVAPPVWLALRPSNRGFAMLRRRGWREGQGVGARIHGPALTPAELAARGKEKGNVESGRGKGRRKARADPGTPAVVGEISGDTDVTIRNVEIIDLTMSDDDASDGPDAEGADEDDALLGSGDDGNESEDDLSPPRPSGFPTDPSPDRDPFAPKELLTPLPIVLKADRLGIGLKAKTEGPYRASRRRVTHSAAALAAHRRAAEALRQTRRELGKGRRAFLKARKGEEEKRKAMLMYLNG